MAVEQIETETPQPIPPSEPIPPTPLQDYEQRLHQVKENPQSLLPTLLARDEVEELLKDKQTLSLADLQHLFTLDSQLRAIPISMMSNLANWRTTLHPPEKAWWWFLDETAKEREARKDLFWILLRATLLILTATLTLEIITRLWEGSPDIYSIFGTLLTLFLTGSPLVKQGQGLVESIFRQVPRLKFYQYAEASAALAALGFVIVLGFWLYLPRLGASYNEEGFEALLAGNLAEAEHNFQRATALSPNQPVTYHNLGNFYRQIGQPNTALEWYQQAIAQDLNFSPAYAGLSLLHNEQGEFDLAVEVALAGLASSEENLSTDVKVTANYNLLSNLGWAYFETEKYQLAEDALMAAIGLEEALKQLPGESRKAYPHYYLAQIYQQQNRQDDACRAWREAFRLLNPDDWSDAPWLLVVRENYDPPTICN